MDTTTFPARFLANLTRDMCPSWSAPMVGTSATLAFRTRRLSSALRSALDSLRVRKASVALVPTMGALHDGHMSLVRLAKKRAGKVVVSIFVNPAQFAPTEDFGSYPRTWKADVAKLAAERVDLIWHPDVKTMYPEGFATKIVPEGPATAGL